MSFPTFAVWPGADKITRTRTASADPQTPPEKSPAAERIWQWQAGTRDATMVEKPSPTKTVQSAPDPNKSIRGIAWRKVVETLRPGERKRRRAKEFDTIMRREIEYPICGSEEADWRTVMSDGEASSYTALMRGAEEKAAAHWTSGNWTTVLGRVAAEDVRGSDAGSVYSLESDVNDNACDTMSLWSALACTRPEDGEGGDEITALPPFQAHQQDPTAKETKDKKVKKAKSMPL